MVLTPGPREVLVGDDLLVDPIEVDTALGDDTVEIGRGVTRVGVLSHEVLCATGYTVVDTAMVDAITLVESAGHLVTPGAQLVTVTLLVV